MAESWKDLAKQLMWEMNPQDNYHGTPYTFKRFDDSKFLTGEGAMVHGPGHYSADYYSTASGYNPGEYTTLDIARSGNKTPIHLKDSYKLKNNMNASKNEVVAYLQKALRRNNKIVDEWLTYSMVDEIPEAREVLENLKDYNVIKTRHTGNVYKVNVPNENFMWKERLPLSEQTPYVRDAWYKNNFDYGKLLNDWSIDHDLEGIRLPNDKKFWRVYNKSINHYGKIKPILRRIFSNQMQALDLPDQLKFLARSGNLDKLREAMGGIKGIRAAGNIDGPINVTFTGDDIRMANTPWQRFVNRIPKQTLSKMANKVITSPAFKSFMDVSPALGVGAEYLKPLDIIRSSGNNKKQKIQQMFNDAGYDVKVQPDGTLLFIM